jgi:hypothetical protein
MTKLHQLHDRHGQSPRLDNRTRGDLVGGHPLWHRMRNRCVAGPARPTREVMT